MVGQNHLTQSIYKKYWISHVIYWIVYWTWTWKWSYRYRMVVSIWDFTLVISWLTGSCGSLPCPASKESSILHVSSLGKIRIQNMNRSLQLRAGSLNIKRLLIIIIKKREISQHLTCLLRNLYADQKATVRTRYGTTDWFKIRKGVHQGCILSPCLFNIKCRVHQLKCWAGWITSWN